jgi:hypothetical protein
MGKIEKVKQERKPYQKKTDYLPILVDAIISCNNRGIMFEELSNISNVSNLKTTKVNVIKRLSNQFGIYIHCKSTFLYIDKNTSIEFKLSEPPEDSVIHDNAKNSSVITDNECRIQTQTKRQKLFEIPPHVPHEPHVNSIDSELDELFSNEILPPSQQPPQQPPMESIIETSCYGLPNESLIMLINKISYILVIRNTNSV